MATRGSSRPSSKGREEGGMEGRFGFGDRLGLGGSQTGLLGGNGEGGNIRGDWGWEGIGHQLKNKQASEGFSRVGKYGILAPKNRHNAK